MQILTLNSPTIQSISYHAQSQRLSVKWRTGTMKTHINVPKSRVHEMIQARSRQLYYQAYIRDDFKLVACDQ